MGRGFARPLSRICRGIFFGDQFVGFGSVDPLRPNAVAELERFPDLGLTSLKVHPTMQAFDPSTDVDISGWKAKYLPVPFLRELKGRLRAQVCFGSDYPMFDPQERLNDVRALDLGAEVSEGLLRNNARRFLGLAPTVPERAAGQDRHWCGPNVRISESD